MHQFLSLLCSLAIMCIGLKQMTALIKTVCLLLDHWQQLLYHLNFRSSTRIMKLYNYCNFLLDSLYWSKHVLMVQYMLLMLIRFFSRSAVVG